MVAGLAEVCRTFILLNSPPEERPLPLLLQLMVEVDTTTSRSMVLNWM
jgi:hypothetical protein